MCALVGEAANLYWANCGAHELVRMSLVSQERRVIAATGYRIQDLAVDETSLYWVEWWWDRPARIMRLDFAGTEAEALVCAEQIEALALGAGLMFWVTDMYAIEHQAPFLVWSQAKDGLVAVPVAEARADRVAANDQTVCWHNLQRLSIECAPHSGTPVTRFDDCRGSVRSLAVSDEAVYWCDEEGLVRAALSGQSVVRLTDARCTQILLDGGSIYYVGHGAIRRLTLATGESVPLASVGRHAPVGLAVDESFVYWADGDDETVNRVGR